MLTSMRSAVVSFSRRCPGARSPLPSGCASSRFASSPGGLLWAMPSNRWRSWTGSKPSPKRTGYVVDTASDNVSTTGLKGPSSYVVDTRKRASDNGRRRRRDRRVAAGRPSACGVPRGVHDADRAHPAADQGSRREHRPPRLRPGRDSRLRRAPAAPHRGLRHGRRPGPARRDRPGAPAPQPRRHRDLRPRGPGPPPPPGPPLARGTRGAGRKSPVTAALGQRVQEYLRLRRALGFRLEREGTVLAQFAAYLEEKGAATITAEHAIAWAQLPQGVDPVNWSHRLTAVRSFAAWLRTTDPAAEIPPRGVFPGQ